MMSENNNIYELNFTCLLTDDNNGNLKFICSESCNSFMYSVRNDISIDELKHLLRNSSYMLECFPEFIESSLTDVKDITPYLDYSNIKINREYIIDNGIYSNNLKDSFVESIEPYFEAFEN